MRWRANHGAQGSDAKSDTMTEALFREDAYLTRCKATVQAINERGGIILDRTVAYPTGGGQPGDSGTITGADGQTISFATTVKGEAPDEIVHVPHEGQTAPAPGDSVEIGIDAARRMHHMRIHIPPCICCPWPCPIR
jgi:misacylated tRNA(Ala) deacylase